MSVGHPIGSEANGDHALAAVVLNYRTPDHAARAVASLLAGCRPPDQLFVVDNDVSENCRQALAPWLPRLTYLHTKQNLGFSGGMNVGINAALSNRAAQVLLLNSDVTLERKCVERLQAVLARDSSAGIAGPLVLSSVRPHRVDSAGIKYSELTGRVRVLVGRHPSPIGMEVRGVPAVSGCVMLVTRSLFDCVGLLDERFFYGFEDLDLCLRARVAGFSTLLVPAAVAYHEGSRSIGAQSARRFYFATRNHLLVASRRRPGEGAVSASLRLSWVVALNVAHAVSTGTATLPDRLRATAMGIRDFCAGRFGSDPAS
jgi:GT2 family glycosyltransferase